MENIKTDYIGLCHYRRYFDFLRSDDFFLEHEELNPNNTQEIEKHIQISSENLIKYFTDGYDIILPKASYLRISFSGQYKRDHELADLHLAAQTVNDLFPDYKKSIDIILKGHKIFSKICLFAIGYSLITICLGYFLFWMKSRQENKTAASVLSKALRLLIRAPFYTLYLPPTFKSKRNSPAYSQ